MTPWERVIMTSSCKDCNVIPKVDDAGKVVGNVQLMHNGLKVVAGGYYGDWMKTIIENLEGHHEPQEELIFHEILKHCRKNTLFVELGSFWCYYTMWYLKEIGGSTAVCIEPDPGRMEVGKKNVELNDMSDRVSFYRGYVRGHKTLDAPLVDMNFLETARDDRFIEIFHTDIQGGELPLLNMLTKSFVENVRFMFISTHHEMISRSPTTHLDCLKKLKELGATILTQHPVERSYSGDGLIVASFMKEDGDIELPDISLNGSRHLFGYNK